MKKINIIYWISTGLLAALMLSSAIQSLMSQPEAVAFMKALGYPTYFPIFLGIAKVLGVIAILVPGFPKLKEWAYAGFTFDLIGAFYSIVAVNGLKPDVFPFFIFVAILAVSYIYFHKRVAAKAVAI